MKSIATGTIRVPSYPMSILRGCASIDEGDAFKDLPDGFIRVVMRLVKKIDVMTPDKAIFARRETLAREAGKSCETVGRALRWLEEQGFISRKQVTRKGLKGSDAHIRPTPKMIEALGFCHRKTNSKAETPPTNSHLEPAVNNDGSISALQKHSINKQSDEPVVQKLSTNVDPVRPVKKTVKVQGRSLPVDLAWLVTEGQLKATGVLRLMTLAKQSGKLLSDVVTVSKCYLQKLAGNDLFAYVRSLLKQDKDFKRIIENETNEAEDRFLKTQRKELIARKAQEWVGRRFREKQGVRVYLVEKGGNLAVSENGKSIGVNWVNGDFVDAVQEGRLLMC